MYNDYKEAAGGDSKGTSKSIQSAKNIFLMKTNTNACIVESLLASLGWVASDEAADNGLLCGRLY